MIDWITMRLALTHSPLSGGVVIAIDPHGVEEWRSVKWMQSMGSHEAKIALRSTGAIVSDTGLNDELMISGNPSKFLQGHNVWGSDDPYRLMRAVCDRLEGHGVLPVVQDATLREATVSRMDITESLQFQDVHQCRAWLSQASIRSHSRNGRPSTYGSTLTFQKSSRRWSVVCYGKGDELNAHKHRLPETLPMAREIFEEAQSLVRIELRLKRKELDELDMRRLVDVTPERVKQLYADYIGRLDMSTQTELAHEVLLTLNPTYRCTYLLHREGVDVRSVLKKWTFYNHRRKLLLYGIDIAVPCPSKDAPEIIPIRRVIEGKQYQAPDWAYEHCLIFQPENELAAMPLRSVS